MFDLQLEDTTMNLDLSTGFGFALTADLSKYVSQKLRIALRIFKGEYFLNNTLGLPYIEEIFRKDPNIDFIEDLYKSKIASIYGVEEITFFELLADTLTRDFVVNFTVKLIDDNTVSLTV